jgi:hypothetical protein
VEEAIPPGMTPPLGKDIDLHMMVDSDHAGDKATRHSCIVFLIFFNFAPIIWLSKKQTTIETSVFGAELIVMKHGIKMLRGLRCKIHMMGIPLTSPSYVYSNNKYQAINLSRAEST